MEPSSRNILKRLLRIEESVRHLLELSDGTFEVQWCLPDGTLHREFGPAIEASNGLTEWWWRGFLHREDGPAQIFEDGSESYYFHGDKCKSLKEVQRRVKSQKVVDEK